MINLHQTSKEEGNILTFLRLLKQFFLQYVEKILSGTAGSAFAHSDYYLVWPFSLLFQK